MSEPRNRRERVFRTLAIVFLLLLAVFIYAPFWDALPSQLGGWLLFGWIFYFGKVLPHMAFNVGFAIDAVVALALALFGLHRVLCWWHGQVGKKETPWRFGWTAKITAMVLLLFGTAIAAVGIVHEVAWFFREKKLIEMRGMGRMTQELSSLKMIGAGVRLYSIDHGGRFPQELNELVPDYLDEHRSLFTRARDGEAPQPMLYFPGYTATDNPKVVILASPRPFESSSGGKRVVVHLDISGTFIKESEFQELMQKQQATKAAR
jgi:hypothetical protein